MNLTIDIGNTRMKVAAFEGDTLLAEEKFEEAYGREVSRLVAHYRPDCLAYCSVAAANPELEQTLAALPCPVLHITGRTPAPVTVCYRTPATLGADRLAAVVGAVTLQPATDLLVIDAGTCITYDLVCADGRYLGGNISPGVEMRFEALHARTARLPRIETEPDDDVPDLGTDTTSAIRAGVVRGIGYELQGCIRHWQKRYPALRIFLTGGDRYAFSDAVRRNILTDSHLVARGLNRLLTYNAEALQHH